MKTSIVKDKSEKFALRIVDMYKYLNNTKKEYVLSKQILRSGTSIGANINEALRGQTKKDFYAKMSIAYKECAETAYWLDLLYGSNYITNKEYDSMSDQNLELLKMLAAITKTQKTLTPNS